MNNMEVGLAVWLSTYHTMLYVQMCLECVYTVDPELYAEYQKWLTTPEGSRYVNYKYCSSDV